MHFRKLASVWDLMEGSQGDYLELEEAEYLVGMASDSPLKKAARRPMVKGRMPSPQTGKTETLFSETHYAARSWPHERQVIIEAEMIRLSGRNPRDNDRFSSAIFAMSEKRCEAI